MYGDFFGLKLLPFNNTPDPRFFFETPDHEEALATLLFAVTQHKGFVVVAGNAGTGKTLVSRLLIDRLPTGAHRGVIHNPQLTGRELLAAICREYEIDVPSSAASSDLTPILQEFLLEQYSRGRVVVLVIDEAQHLSVEALETLRMLANLETDDAKLIQIVLLGQPAFHERIASPEMVQLRQRIFRSVHLRAFDRDATAGYIGYRLAVAGGGSDEAAAVFEPAAIDLIYEKSGGIPRIINHICDNAMLMAFTHSCRRVTHALVDQVAPEVLPPWSHVPAEPAAEAPYAEAGDPASAGLQVEEMRNQIAALVRENRRLLAEAREVQQAAQAAVGPAKEAREQIDSFRREALEEVAAARRQLQARLAEALQQADTIRSQSRGVAAELAERISQTRMKLEAAVGEADKSARQSQETAREAQAEFRHVLLQIVERTDRARRDIVATSHEACGKVSVSLQRLEETSKALQASLNADRAEARRDSDASIKKLTELQQHNERQIRTVAQDAAAGLESLRAFRAEALGDFEQWRRSIETTVRENADRAAAAKENVAQIAAQVNQLLATAQSSACQLTQQAAEQFEQARGDWQRQKEEANALSGSLRQNADGVQREIRELREGARQELEQVRKQLTETTSLLCEARRDAVNIHGDLRAFNDNARCQTQALLHEAAQLRARLEELLAMPRSLIDETSKKAQTLGEISRKTAAVVDRLAKAGEDANGRHTQLTGATREADEKIDVLKRQTARVGQLVGIVRQLYGSMDARARIEAIRARLDQADDLCRSVVPREMDNLRSILVEQLTTPSLPAAGSRPIQPDTTRSAAPAKAGGGKSGPQPATTAQRGSLGDVAARNRRLHEWLKDTLAEAQSQPPASQPPQRDSRHLQRTAPRRIDPPVAAPPISQNV